MVTKTVESLCKSAGQIIHSNGRSQTEGGDFMWVRVEINVHKPLCRGRKVRFSQDRKGWASFCYEWLPIFCHWCGILNHDSKDCDLWLQSKGELRIEDQEYGPGMRVDPPSLLRKKAVWVSGIGVPSVASSWIPGQRRETQSRKLVGRRVAVPISSKEDPGGLNKSGK